jgi:hypothetical protein
MMNVGNSYFIKKLQAVVCKRFGILRAVNKTNLVLGFQKDLITFIFGAINYGRFTIIVKCNPHRNYINYKESNEQTANCFSFILNVYNDKGKKANRIYGDQCSHRLVVGRNVYPFNRGELGGQKNYQLTQR